MRLPFAFLVLLWFAHFVPSAAAEIAQLRHPIPAPPTGAHPSTLLGFRVAIDGNIAVAGAPTTDFGETASGVVKVFNATTGALLHVIPNPTPTADERFGEVVAISGTRIVVGSPNKNVPGAASGGCAYVFDLASQNPTVPVVILNNPSPVSVDSFGSAIAISGAKVVVIAGNNRAYIFDLESPSPGVATHILPNPAPAGGYVFGIAAAISGSRIVIGASRYGDGLTDLGNAYVYDLAGANPTAPVVTLPNPAPSGVDSFGKSVAIAGSTVVVGAYTEDLGVSDAGCAYVFDVAAANPTTPIATLNNPTPANLEYFGYSVSISGTRILVGAHFDDFGNGRAGSAYVFDLNRQTPATPIATFNNPTPSGNDQFGRSVAISGSLALVASYQDDTVALNAGSAYVYDVASATPTTVLATLNTPSPTAGDGFGTTVALSGNILVVGSPLDDSGAADSGCVFVFNLASPTPANPIAKINNPSPATNDQFGNSVAISGSIVVVGSHLDDTGATDSGSVYVFDLANGPPAAPIHTIPNPTPATVDLFGFAVAISGQRIVAGAHGDDTGASGAGSAYVFDLSKPSPTVPVATLNNPEPGLNDQFGYSVGISGSRVVAGARQDSQGASSAGSAYVFDILGETPLIPIATLHNPEPTATDWFGNSVAISGTRVAVGAMFDDFAKSASGSVYVYDVLSGSPSVPFVILRNPALGLSDFFGRSVAFSGNHLVVGAQNGGTADAGSIHVFNFSLSDPTIPIATLNNPTSAFGDGFGTGVAIDGSLFVGGTPGEDTVMLNKGAAYVFELDIAPPQGGTLSIAPTSPIRPQDPLTGLFENWTDNTLPISYAIRAGGTELVPAGQNSAPTFKLPDGVHEVFGRISDSAGNFTDTSAFTIIVDGSPPTIVAPAAGFFPATLIDGEAMPDFVSQANISDNIGIATKVQDPSPGSIVPAGFPGNITITATDTAGNFSTIQFSALAFAPAPVSQAIHATGSLVPNAGIDGRIQPGALWTSFQTPALNDAGIMAFVATWRSPSIQGPVALPTQIGTGIFLGDNLIAKVGESVAGAGTGNLPSNATYKSFRDPVINENGQIAFLANIQGSGVNERNDGVVVSTGRTGLPEIITREGDPAPGVSGATFKSFANAAIQGSSDSTTIFTASIVSATSTRSQLRTAASGAWWLPAGESSLRKIVCVGDAWSNGETLQSFALLEPLPDSPAHGRGPYRQTGALLKATSTKGFISRQSLIHATPEALTEITSTDHALADLSPDDMHWKSFNFPATGAEGNFISLLGTVTTANHTSSRGIFASSDAGATWQLLARIGGVAVGGLNGEVWQSFRDPVNSNSSEGLAFFGTAKGSGGRPSASYNALWWKPVGAPLMLVAKQGTFASLPEVIRWQSFQSLALPGGNTGPVFTAKVRHQAGGNRRDLLGLYAVDSRGTLHELLRSETQIEGKTVKSFDTLKVSIGSAGVARCFNSQHTIVALITFSDRSTAITKFTLP